MYILLSLLVAAPALAENKASVKFDWNCESALAPVAEGALQVLAARLALASGGELFTRIERPVGGATAGYVLAVHGFLDSHRAFDALTPALIARGYGVVRPDLPGFARSLRPHHAQGAKLDYRESVRDLGELIPALRRYGIDRPRLLGHSRGAGLVLALLAVPGIAESVDARHVIVNPYVYPNEQYVAKKMHLSSFTNLASWIPSVLKILPQIMVDSVVDPQLRAAFATYLRTARQTEGLDLDDYRVRRALDEQVDVALGIIRGQRRLNSLHEIDRIPRAVRVDMIYGARDDVVEPALARELARRVRVRGGSVVEIRAGHHIPSTNVAELLELIVDASARREGV